MKKRFTNLVNNSIRFKIATAAVIGSVWLGQPQQTNAQTVNDADSHEIVQKLADKLEDSYPFPDISALYKSTLLKNEAAGRYKNLSESELASRLTQDLNKAHKDVHLHVMRNEESYRSLTGQDQGGGRRGNGVNNDERANYGFKSVEIDGATSTAYINVPGPFMGSQEAFEMAAAAMNMAAYCKNIIIDVRNNPGGTGHMGRFLASYFYNAGNEQYYLNGFYKDRSHDEQEWTYSFVPGKRMPDAKLYILVNGGTASASEGFAYAMQKLRRGIIVGDTTAGAGIAGSFIPLKNNLIVFTPFKMVVAPNSLVGWEGTGVIPDVATEKQDALAATRKLILTDIMNNSADTDQRESARWVIEDKEVPAVSSVNMKAKYGSLVGKYSNNITIPYVNGKLLWNTKPADKPAESFPMYEVKPDVLVIEGLNANIGTRSSRVYISRDDKGKVNGLNRKTLLGNGTIYSAPSPIMPQ